MSDAFPNLFQPITLGSKVLKHRLNFGAHTANMSVEGLPYERHLGYYRERAMGGAAMIVVEPVPVHPTAVLTRGNFLNSDDAVIPHFRRITDACHEYGAVMIQQLYHVGAHGDWDNSFSPNWSPSGLPSLHDTDGSHAMSAAEIEEIISGFVQAARRAKDGGFDGCELMAAYNALIEQFWSPICNRRDDFYGGTFENRLRFSQQVLGRIRKQVGPDFIIGVAISVDSTYPDVLSMEQQQEIAAWHDERGLYDYVTVGTGGYFDFPSLMPTAIHSDKLGASFAEQIKQVVKHAKVQSESHIRTPDNADYVIASGQADMVSIVRGQIADPHMANKAKGNHAGDIRPCLSCNQMCWGRRSRDYWISCVVNPSAGREFEWGGDRFTGASIKREVLVIGAGPAGLETSRVAASRGHRVILVEASNEIGGQFRLAGLQPRRGQILDLIGWYGDQLSKLGVDLRFNTPVEASDIESYQADVIVVATGSLPTETGYQRFLPNNETLPGVELANVFSVEDVMSKNARLGERVLLLDDTNTWRGCGTCWLMAENGHRVTLLTAGAIVGQELVRTSSDIPLRGILRKLNVEFITESVVLAWRGGSAALFDFNTGQEYTKEFDSLVLACANRSENSLEAEIRDQGMDDGWELHLVGDCVAPRQAQHAIYEGRKLALTL